MATPVPSRRVTKKVRPPPRHAVTDTFLDETFKKLSHAIVQIQQRNVSSLSFETHYRNAYNLCLHRRHKLLYDGIADLVVANLERQAKERIEPAFPSSSVLTAATTASTSSEPSTTSASSARNRAASTGEAAAVISTNSAVARYGQGRMAQAMEGETFLNAIKTTWEEHKTSMSKISSLTGYLDKTYTIPEGKASVYTLGLHLFLTHLIRHPKIPIEQNLLNVSLAMIRIERDGELFSQDLLRAVTDMMCELREVSNDEKKGEGEPIYKSWWQEKFLDSTREYYTLEAETNVERLSAPEYLERVDRRLKEEKDRIQQYLHPTTEPLLFSLLDHVLISSNLQAIVDHPNAGLAVLLAEDRYSDLARMYRLFGRVGEGRTVVARAMKAWLVGQGQKIVDTLGTAQAGSSKAAAGASGEGMDEDAPVDTKGKGKEKTSSTAQQAAAAAPTAGTAAHTVGLALEWVNTVLDLKDKMDKIAVEAFEKDRIFQNAINDAFLSFINQVKKAPEYISIYLDDNLKKGLKGKNESEVDVVLDKTVTLFRFLNDKDVFEDFYKRHLAKRLLSDRSVSEDAERGMLQKLKLECGASFVAKLEGMLKDVTASEELNKGYRNYLQGLGGERRTATDLSVKICTASFWPSNPDVPCNLPPDFIKIAKSFERYFETKHTGRKLTWHAEHGSVDVRIRFDKGVKDINVATHGFVVLNAFAELEKGQSLSYEHLASATGMEDAQLKRTLQSLACAKFKILKKDPVGRNVAPTDTFTFNHAFTAPVMRIKIATIASRVENVEEAKETDTRLEAERSQVVEAAIVRTMKSRKELPTPELTNEVIAQLSRRFTPKPAGIKLSIEKLIEKEYLERDSKDRKLLRYLA